MRLSICNIAKHYGDTLAIRDVTFDVASGEIVSLIGPNGAGKSTTIGILTGTLPATSGRVLVDGQPLERDSLEVRRRIGYIPDHPEVYEHLTAREFARYVAGLYGVSAKEADKRASQWFSRFDLTGREGEQMKGYSYGMRQKAVIVATLTHRPDVLVLDEPIVGLDPTSARTLRMVLREQADAGVAVLFSTHLLSIAETVADRVVLIAHGSVIAQGTVAALRSGADVNLEASFFRLLGDAA